MSRLICVLFVLLNAELTALADDFFNIEEPSFHTTAPAGETQVMIDIPRLDGDGKPLLGQDRKPIVDHKPAPFLAAHVSVKEQVRADSVIAKAYFFDGNRQLIGTDDAPFGKPWSVFVPANARSTVLFSVPDKVLSTEGWSAVIVFGDKKGVDAQVYSDGSRSEPSDYDFSEKSLVEDKNGPPIERKPAMDPLVEHVEQTDNPQQPQITLFMRPPLGMADASEAKGVLCMSLLADSLDDVKKQLQGFQAGEDLSGILKYAQDHKLIIICWGSRGLWDPRKSWDDLSPDAAWNTDKAFDQVASAWEKGVQYFIKEYGIPRTGYLMWGISGSAQYACRLALRKPDYFLAVDIHIPSSFDKPTPDGRKILWCLTTGELESGHNRSLRFYEQCKALGYPMIYKAIVGLGHAGSPIANELGLRFFDYALSVKDQRSAYDQSLNDPLKQFDNSQHDTSNPHPWLSSFITPAFIGDAINQGIVPYEKRDTVPVGYRVPLPTQVIAQAWDK